MPDCLRRDIQSHNFKIFAEEGANAGQYFEPLSNWVINVKLLENLIGIDESDKSNSTLADCYSIT